MEKREDIVTISVSKEVKSKVSEFSKLTEIPKSKIYSKGAELFIEKFKNGFDAEEWLNG